MQINETRKINIKSNSGFTMTDLIVALAIFIAFVGVIATLLYSTFRLNLQTKLAGESVNYAIQILEDIDKISYDEVKDGMEEYYIEKFEIPNGFDLKIKVLNDETLNNQFVKKVKLNIEYKFSGNFESIVIERLKVKEI